jgi:HlyD family secretion protein
VLKLVRDSAGPVIAGAPLLELGDPRKLDVAVDVLSSEATTIAPGMLVVLGGWGGDRTLRGRVRLIEPAGFTRISALVLHPSDKVTAGAKLSIRVAPPAH